MNFGVIWPFCGGVWGPLEISEWVWGRFEGFQWVLGRFEGFQAEFVGDLGGPR